MTHTTASRTTVRRTSSALGAATLLGLALTGPALAGPIPDDQRPVGTVPLAIAVHAHPKGQQAADDSSVNAVEDRMAHRNQPVEPVGPPAYNSWPHGTGSAPDTHAGLGTITAPRLDEGSIQYLQVGIGVLGGAVLTAAAAGAVASRNRHHALSA